MNEKDEVKENVDAAEQENTGKKKEVGDFLRIISPFFNIMLLVFNIVTDYDSALTGVVNGILLCMSGLTYYYGKKLCGDDHYRDIGLWETCTGGAIVLICILIIIFT